ncbi:MAG: prepilin-type N-terminal cleavage/methylation domain-containing protein [Candidatus Krumholzibacteriia bacterium]|nr:prepilin-type N-terminal cleavage/methylation domain-containing protein [bacterium]MCB9514081.1 prepilin-type N-terminal cleavage/methylation domain-containing protein [Candidatus Latescibacterota bacterium]MCB9515693.1 prepilin-type N-terminal cleavage/methylation domain-containing protein [Candidatus Latescibacterota bacterium]
MAVAPRITARALRSETSVSRAGFTLVELMAAVAVFGILLSIAVPSVYHSMDSMESRQNAESLSGRLRLARSQALSSYSDVVVYFNRDGAGTYTVHVDNGGGTGTPDDPDFDPANKNNGVVDDEERVFTPVSLPARCVFGYVPGATTGDGVFLDTAISFAGAPKRVTFRADGTCDASGWISVMPLEDFLDQEPGRDYLVELTSTTGEVRVERAQH